ncbi:EAL domain-containing protein, partial [Acinetobacter baumannii]|nr:EAL domain-containing protein [Acinetobacter baumannii]
LSLRIVAEGVENDAQRRWLQAAGVEVLQGHLFGCALPQEAFSARYLSPVREDENL